MDQQVCADQHGPCDRDWLDRSGRADERDGRTETKQYRCAARGDAATRQGDREEDVLDYSDEDEEGNCGFRFPR